MDDTVFRVLMGVDQGAELRLTDGRAIVGRDPSSEIVLNDPRVSRRHARVWVEEGALLIEDLGSRSGTAVNGGVVSGPAALRAGDQVLVGFTRLEVVWAPPVAATVFGPAVGGAGDPWAAVREATCAPGEVPLPAEAPPTASEADDDGYATFNRMPSAGRDPAPPDPGGNTGMDGAPRLDADPPGDPPPATHPDPAPPVPPAPAQPPVVPPGDPPPGDTAPGDTAPGDTAPGDATPGGAEGDAHRVVGDGAREEAPPPPAARAPSWFARLFGSRPG